MSTFQSYRVLRAEAVGTAACQRLLACLVVPRPIAWISTRASSGIPNLAPFSAFAPLARHPPLVGVSFARASGGRPKDTLVNIRATGAFCINTVAEPLLEAMGLSSGSYPPEIDELRLAGLAAAPASLVDAPCVRDAGAVLECRLQAPLEPDV